MKSTLEKEIQGKIAELQELCGKAGMSVDAAVERYADDEDTDDAEAAPLPASDDNSLDEPAAEMPAADGDEDDKAARKAIVVAALRKKMG